MASQHSDEIVARFEKTLGRNAASGLETLRILEWIILPFNAIEQREEETLRVLVQGEYAYPDFWYCAYFINVAGSAVVEAYQER